jgi:hypothetical protein
MPDHTGMTQTEEYCHTRGELQLRLCIDCGSASAGCTRMSRACASWYLSCCCLSFPLALPLTSTTLICPHGTMTSRITTWHDTLLHDMTHLVHAITHYYKTSRITTCHHPRTAALVSACAASPPGFARTLTCPNALTPPPPSTSRALASSLPQGTCMPILHACIE